MKMLDVFCIYYFGKKHNFTTLQSMSRVGKVSRSKVKLTYSRIHLKVVWNSTKPLFFVQFDHPIPS